ncbi:hypothetical protein sphantq_02483 [Sphingobium sp. AntQ-1]|uniref:ATP-binding protein n=1 Tax=Sphingobium sp. AntQ-1 TaxID=2930091 RepID=UPI00234F01BB|nr:ATP-binding protein [Sphingobium sp. AntQ-1]WCP14041.1 hypothetical protein sphantq_02483 [Sphingobium sp. AntQ-1]
MTTYKKPKRNTGLAKPDPYDVVAQTRAEHAQGIVENIWVDTARQRQSLNEIRKYMRISKKKRRGTPLGGRRLSQFSQAGKSAIAERLIYELEQEAIQAGSPPNPFRVIHITISARMTLKMLFLAILNRLADNFAAETGRGHKDTEKEENQIRGKSGDNVMILEQRIEEWVARLGVELIVIDEVQLLATKNERSVTDPDYGSTVLTADAFEVTKKLQSFIDRGVVPIVFIGDETSESFFKINGQFAARLGTALELPPLNVKKASDRQQFMNFCKEYDRQLVAQGATPVPTCLTEHAVLTGLIAASGGHIGRAARIIQVAMPAALERGAVTMEAYDLSNAIRDYVMDLGWIDYDPFSLQPVTKAPEVDETEDAE